MDSVSKDWTKVNKFGGGLCPLVGLRARNKNSLASRTNDDTSNLCCCSERHGDGVAQHVVQAARRVLRGAAGGRQAAPRAVLPQPQAAHRQGLHPQVHT